MSQTSHESPDDELTDEGGAAAFTQRRKKRHLDRRATLQFYDSMAAFEGESNSDRDEEEEDATITASDDSFIVGDDIFA